MFSLLWGMGRESWGKSICDERCGYSEVLWAARVSVQVCVLWDMPEVEVSVAQDQREWAYIVSWLAVFMSR